MATTANVTITQVEGIFARLDTTVGLTYVAAR
jgi:hypothetical protein